MEAREALRDYPLFALLGPRGIDIWLGAGSELTVQTGQTLIEAGQQGTTVFVVLEGKVRLLRRSRSSREVAMGVLGPGSAFGEYALLPPHENTATCRACEPDRVLRLPLSELRRAHSCFREIHEHLKNWLRLHAMLGYLREGVFLGFLSAPSVLPLLDRCDEATYPAGWSFQADGLSADRWFYVRSGAVAVQDVEGEAAVPRDLGPGDCFGERGLLERGRRVPAAVNRPIGLQRGRGSAAI